MGSDFNHTSGGMVLHTLDQGATPYQVGSLTALSIPKNTTTQPDDGGQVFDRTRSVTNQSPMPSFSTKAIDLLSQITSRGLCIRSDPTHPGWQGYGQKRGVCAAGATPPGANDHVRYTVHTGLIVPRTLTGSRGEDMVLSCEIHSLTDGPNAPVIIEENVAVPVDMPLSQWALGSLRIAGIVFDDIDQFTLDFNITEDEKLPLLGDVWPASIGVAKIQPLITCIGRNPRRLAPYGATGAGQIGYQGSSTGGATSDSQFLFRKRLNRGVFDTGDVHMRCDIRGFAVFDNPFAASGAARAQTTIRIEGMEETIASVAYSPLTFTYNVPYEPFT